MPRPFLYPAPERSSVLIISLWAFAVLSILSMALANFVYQQIRFTNFFMRSTISLPLARSELMRTFIERNLDGEPEYDSLAALSEEKERILCNNVKYNYYFVDKKNDSGGEAIIDEGALININLASSSVLQRLPGLSDDLAENIIKSKLRPFMLKEEILLVEGIDKEKFDQLKDLITVQGSGQININTVSSGVLSALGLDDDLIEKIMRYRKEYAGEDEEPGTADDGVFTGTGKILSNLRDMYSLSTRQQQDLLALNANLSVKSEYLRLNVSPQIKGKEGVHYSIVIHPRTKKIISWREW